MYKSVYYYLWIAPHALLALVAVLMMWRRLYKEFPIFFSYVVYQVLEFVFLFALGTSKNTSPSQFYNATLLDVAVSTALRFGVIHEIFDSVFRNYRGLTHLGQLLFRWATIVLLFAGVVAAGLSYADNINHLAATLYVTSLVVSIVQCGLLLLLFTFSRYFGLSWRNYVFGTALGFGIYACVDLINSAIETQFGTKHADLLTLVTMGTYHCCVLIWIGYLLAPERKMRTFRPPAAGEIDSWNDELERLLQQQ